MGRAFIRISWLSLWLFCCFLSGCPVVTTGTENRKEPQGLSELVQTQRVHDVIWGSRTAVSHCVIVYSLARCVQYIDVVEKVQGHKRVYFLVGGFLFLHTLTFSLSTHLNSHELFKSLFCSNTHTKHKNTHSFSLCGTAMCTHGRFSIVLSGLKQSDIEEGLMYILLSPNSSYFSAV